jgi:hypothetical protein
VETGSLFRGKAALCVLCTWRIDFHKLDLSFEKISTRKLYETVIKCMPKGTYGTIANEMPRNGLASLLVIQFFNQATAKQIILYVNTLDDNKDVFWYWVCNTIHRWKGFLLSSGNYDLGSLTSPFLGHVEIENIRKDSRVIHAEFLQTFCRTIGLVPIEPQSNSSESKSGDKRESQKANLELRQFVGLGIVFIPHWIEF